MSDDENNDNSEADHERRQAFRLDMEKELVDILWTNEQQQQQQRKIT